MTTTTRPFTSEHVIRRLLDPAAVEGQPRGATLLEWRAAFGVNGENCAATWSRHAEWLKQAAMARNIAPVFDDGCFYVESVANKRSTHRD